MSNEILQHKLKQALENSDTALVYDLYKEGANLKDFKIWGIIKPNGGWSEKKIQEIDNNKRANPDYYFITMESSKFWQDEGFTSQLIVSEQDKLLLKAKKNDIREIIRENDLKSFRDYLDKLKGPKGLYTLVNVVVPEVIRSKNTEMYKIAYPRITLNASIGNCLRAAWDIGDSKIYSHLLNKLKDPKCVAYYCNEFFKLETPKRLKQLEDDLKPKQYFTPKQYFSFFNNSSDVQQEMFDQLLKRSSKEAKQGILLSHYIKNNNQALFEVLFPRVTDQDPLCEALKTAVYIKNHRIIDKILPKVTDQKKLGHAALMSLSDDRAAILDKILLKITNKSVLNNIRNTAKLIAQPDRKEDILRKINGQIAEIDNMSINNNSLETQAKSDRSR